MTPKSKQESPNLSKKQHTPATDAQIRDAIAYMSSMFPDPATELHYETPRQLLLAVLLSAQTTDVNVNRATAPIFGTMRSPADLVEMGEPAFRDAIKTLSFYKTKAKHALETARRLSALASANDVITAEIAQLDASYHPLVSQVRQEHGYYIPSTLPSLTSYPGVGEKTAKVVLHTLYGMPYLAVDTHVHRVANRLERVTTDKPLQTSALLEQIIPADLLMLAHHTIILFGRYHCTAKKPHCDTCQIKHLCTYAAKTLERKHQ